jgi:hypothetical protein
VLAALADAPYYFLTASGFAWEQIVTFITAAFACYLLVGDADQIGSKGRNLSISRRRNKRAALFATLAPGRLWRSRRSEGTWSCKRRVVPFLDALSTSDMQ